MVVVVVLHAGRAVRLVAVAVGGVPVGELHKAGQRVVARQGGRPLLRAPVRVRVGGGVVEVCGGRGRRW